MGRSALRNPANVYRTRLILHHLGTPKPGSKVVDIGSGQGEFTLLLEAKYPDIEVLGLEYSYEGVQRASRAAHAAGLKARFIQRDLLESVSESDELAEHCGAELAVCTEVLEHVDQPETLLRNAASYLKSGCKLVVTVPGGPRSAFDRSIGHRRHYGPTAIRDVLESAGYEVERIERSGFPFFDLYRLVVIARGKRLISDVTKNRSASDASLVQRLVIRFFSLIFQWNLRNSPFGWQIVAVARLR